MPPLRAPRQQAPHHLRGLDLVWEYHLSAGDARDFRHGLELLRDRPWLLVFAKAVSQPAEKRGDNCLFQSALPYSGAQVENALMRLFRRPPVSVKHNIISGVQGGVKMNEDLSHVIYEASHRHRDFQHERLAFAGDWE